MERYAMSRKQRLTQIPGSLLGEEITRRDFVNGALVGVGATLLGAAAPGCSARQGPAPTTTDSWTGYGGVGDYATANGNVASVRDAAHLIRDGLTGAMMNEVKDTGEEYDMVIIGGGFSGIGAAYQFHKTNGGAARCLILENHSVFGGEAKQNEFEVDGFRLFGPQGSNDFGPPNKDDESLIADIYRDTGLPFDYEFVPRDKHAIRAPLEHYYGMYWEEERYDTGYFLGKDADPSWVVNPRSDKLVRLPWSDEFKDEMNRVFADVEDYYTGDDLDAWLDSMSYKELLEDVMGYSPQVTAYFDPVLAISMGGVGADVYSAYSAKLLDMPGTSVHYTYDPDVESAYSFPGGNAGIFRHIVKYLNPHSIEGGNSFEEILFNAIDFSALDTEHTPGGDGDRCQSRRAGRDSRSRERVLSPGWRGKEGKGQDGRDGYRWLGCPQNSFRHAGGNLRSLYTVLPFTGSRRKRGAAQLAVSRATGDRSRALV
jgi:spermidine dehydrogenase